MPDGSQILDQGRTPEEWSATFAARGMTVSARLLRQEARRLGACHVIGHGAMLITPAQLDAILEARQCRIMIDRPYRGTEPAAVFRHERGHCNGWPGSHPD